MRKSLFPSLLSCVLLFVTSTGISQTNEKPINATWDVLEDIDYVDKYVTEVKQTMMFPKFTPAVLALRGKTVIVSGYTVPFDKTGARVVLSANPYASCFFCGKASAASIMTIVLKKPNAKYQVDDIVNFKGKLKLNESNFREYYYILEDAEEVKQ